MKYVKAETVFPEALLKEIQKYMYGGLVYIPNPEGTRKSWGESSGGRQYLLERNRKIREDFRRGHTLDQLSDQFCLSLDSIKKIVYSGK